MLRSGGGLGGRGGETPTQVPRACDASTNLAAHHVELSHFLELRQWKRKTGKAQLSSTLRSARQGAAVQNASSFLISRHLRTKPAFTRRSRAAELAPKAPFRVARKLQIHKPPRLPASRLL